LEGIIEDEDLAANMDAPPLNPKLLTAIQGAMQFIFLILYFGPGSASIGTAGSGSGSNETDENKLFTNYLGMF